MKIEKISKSYNSKKILNNVDLYLPEKGLIYFVGDNGSGKTTFLNIVSGIEKKDYGSIFFQDKEIKDFTLFRREKIHYLMQDNNLFEHQTVIENINLTTKKNKEFIEGMLYDFNMQRFKNRKIANLSGGQKRKVAIVRSFLCDSEIIFADEPTKGLDYKTAEKIIEHYRVLSNDKLVVIVNHDISLIKKDDTIYSFENGKIIEVQYETISKYTVDKKTINVKKQKIVDFWIESDNDEIPDISITKTNNDYYLNVPEDFSNNFLVRKQNIKKVDTKDNQKNVLVEKKLLIKHNKPFIFTGFILCIIISFIISMLFMVYTKVPVKKDLYLLSNKYNEIIKYDGNAEMTFKQSSNYTTIFEDANGESYPISSLTYWNLNRLQVKDLILGEFPTKDNEIIIDINLLSDKNPNKDLLRMIDIKNNEDLLNEKFFINGDEYKVTGLVNKKTNGIYLQENMILKSYLGKNMDLIDKVEIESEIDEKLKLDNYIHIYGKKENEIGLTFEIVSYKYQIVGVYKNESNHKFLIESKELDNKLKNNFYVRMYTLLDKKDLKNLNLQKNNIINLYDGIIEERKIGTLAETSEFMITIISIIAAILVFYITYIILINISKRREYGIYKLFGKNKKEMTYIYISNMTKSLKDILIGYILGAIILLIAKSFFKNLMGFDFDIFILLIAGLLIMINLIIISYILFLPILLNREIVKLIKR
ncbi:ATP-binding cassette domain-containing protein [Haploplasma axanthum]|uniref:ABC transporter ATPase n=1 Tax=Haploplasma axanthum TaxID=29552 RepID=A0A449BCT7_HAPAX|nr:ATP-binding cassette domain-containing protein [Haploplasma axanthum]VEU80150.1 ABC transporter ATPase [Haploplasma axanthum]